jgi:hypothetical protein
MATALPTGIVLPDSNDNISRLAYRGNLQTINDKLIERETVLNAHMADNAKHVPYAVDTGAANAYAVTLSPAPTSYTDGMAVCVKIANASTGGSTINVNGLGAKTILDSLGNAITAGGLKANTPYTLRYNGTNFIVQGKGGGGNATAAQLLSGATATVDSGPITGTMPNNGAVAITPGTANKAIAAGYHNGSGYVVGDANLIPANIPLGKSIFGIQGILQGKDDVDTYLLNMPANYAIVAFVQADSALWISTSSPLSNTVSKQNSLGSILNTVTLTGDSSANPYHVTDNYILWVNNHIVYVTDKSNNLIYSFDMGTSWGDGIFNEALSRLFFTYAGQYRVYTPSGTVIGTSNFTIYGTGVSSICAPSSQGAIVDINSGVTGSVATIGLIKADGTIGRQAVNNKGAQIFANVFKH